MKTFVKGWPLYICSRHLTASFPQHVLAGSRSSQPSSMQILLESYITLLFFLHNPSAHQSGWYWCPYFSTFYSLLSHSHVASHCFFSPWNSSTGSLMTSSNEMQKVPFLTSKYLLLLIIATTYFYFLFWKIFLKLIWKLELHRIGEREEVGRERESPYVHWLITQMDTTARTEQQGQNQEPGNSHRSSTGIPKAQALRSASRQFPGYQQEVEMEVEQPRIK